MGNLVFNDEWMLNFREFFIHQLWKFPSKWKLCQGAKENNMASLRHIGTIESDQEIEDFESDESVQEEEKVQ